MTPTKIRTIRKGAGMTVSEFALYCLCSVDSVHSWEAGRRNPPALMQAHILKLERKQEANR